MQQVEFGLYSLDDPLMLRRSDEIAGSGVLQHLTPGLTMPIRDWTFLMMNISDNLATNRD
ncbi:MAG: serine hydrolase [Chloroflexi bacterium]|nr:serine hydrolase [Chloroflexota bacterium]